MAATYRQRFLRIVRANERDMTALFERLHTDIVRILRQYENADGIIPPLNSHTVRNSVNALVMAAFVSGMLGTQPAAFTVERVRVRPQSDYMRALWPKLEAATRIAVEQHASIMDRGLRNAPDVRAAFMTAWRNPFAEARRVQEQTDWRPRRFVDYDPVHRFVDPNGYTLSARIWDTAQQTRRKIDLFMADGIASGKGARKLAAELEQFLLPGRKLIRTNKPYGTNASYDAMRLSRTEITAAYGRAGRMAAYANPFVNGADWVRSRSSGPCGVCDDLEAGSPYTLDSLPDLPGDSHPQCVCHYRWNLEPTADVITALRDELPSAGFAGALPSIVALVTPLLVDQFVRYLLDEPELERDIA